MKWKNVNKSWKLLLIVILLLIIGCENKRDDGVGDSAILTEQVISSTMVDEQKNFDNAIDIQNNADDSVSIQGGLEDVPDAQGIIDLTSLSSTMIYGEVYNMMYYPENYIGKTVKMCGTYTEYKDTTTGNFYSSCIIQDATACCSQGLEFELTNEYSYPNDYPEVGNQITVIGTFDTYKEGERVYCTLREASLDK